MKDEVLKEDYTAANEKNWTKLELEDYLRASIKERDEIGRIEFAEKKSYFKVAKTMKDNGEPIDKIILYTNLKREEIEKL